MLLDCTDSLCCWVWLTGLPLLWGIWAEIAALTPFSYTMINTTQRCWRRQCVDVIPIPQRALCLPTSNRGNSTRLRRVRADHRQSSLNRSPCPSLYTLYAHIEKYISEQSASQCFSLLVPPILSQREPWRQTRPICRMRRILSISLHDSLKLVYKKAPTKANISWI